MLDFVFFFTILATAKICLIGSKYENPIPIFVQTSEDIKTLVDILNIGDGLVVHLFGNDGKHTYFDFPR